MKKVKKVLATSAVLAGSLIGLTACGEVYINFETTHGELDKIVFDKDSYKEDIQDALTGLDGARPGYKVEGVYLDEEFKTKLTDLSVLKEDITLYIKWTEADIPVRYDANGGEGTIPETLITYRKSKTITNNVTAMTRTGYSLVGWNTKADGTGDQYSVGGAFIMDSTTPVTLYAVWEANGYTVAYEKGSNQATGEALTDLDVKFDSEFTIKANTYARKGYTFAGWNTKADGTGTTYQAGDTVTLTSTGMNLYAMWTANNYKINYAKGSDSGVEGEAIAEDTCYYDSTFEVTTSAYQRPGFELVGWKIDGMGDVLEAGDTVPMIYDKDITLYPVWQVANLSFNASEVADLFSHFVEGTTNYDFAVVKGVSYEFPNTTVVSVSNESATGIATITDNRLVVNGVGTFKLRLAKTSDLDTVWDFSIIAKNNAGTIAYFSDNAPTATSGTAWDNSTADRYNYTYDVVKTLESYSKLGYTFTGWKLRTPAMINGQMRPIGYEIGNTIPANSFGEIVLDAMYTINEYDVVAYDYDFDNDKYYSTPYLTMTGEYNTDWTIADGYDVAKLYADTATKAQTKGYVFVGWFEDSNLNDSVVTLSDNPFDGTISFMNGYNLVNGRIYAKYVRKLSAPTNIVATGTTITWNEVDDADSYEIMIGGVKYESNTNAFIVNLESGEQKVKVRAIRKITNTGWQEVDASSDFSAEVTLNIQNVNSVISIKTTDNNIDYATTEQIFFSGHEYNFVYAQGQERSFEVVEGSESVNGLINVSTRMDETTEIYTITTASDKTGTFKLKRIADNKLITVRVVEAVSRVMKGDTYTNFESRIETSLDESSNDYQVGAGNGYKFDIKIADAMTNYFDESYFADTTKSVFKFKASVDGENWFDADTHYYNASTNTISTSSEGGVSLVVTRNETDGRYFHFSNDIADYDLMYRAEVYLPYTRLGNAVSTIYMDKDGNLDIAKSELSSAITIDVAVNSGVNVYDCQGLKDAYGDLNIHVINIHGDITAVLSAYQTQEDGSPISTESRNVRDSKYHLSSYSGVIPKSENNYKPDHYDPTDNQTNDYQGSATVTKEEGTEYHAEYKADGNIFRRVDNDKTTADRIVVNGNHAIIDASAVKRINNAYCSPVDDDSDWGYHYQTGTLKGTQQGLPKSQIGVFRYQVPNAVGSVAVFNNLKIVGNKLTAEQEKEYTTDEQLAEREIINAGSYSGIFAENSAIVLNNCIMQNLQNAVRNDGVTYDGKYNNNFNAKTEVNYSQINNTYMSCLYGWCINSIEVYNSNIFNQGGLPIHIADAEGLVNNVPYAYIDKNSILENYITGSEAWFNIFGFNQMALMMKAGIQNAMSTFNASVIKNMPNSNDEYINMIMLYQPQDVEEYNKDGYGSVTKSGGEKKIVKGAYDSNADNPGEFAGYVYDTNAEVIGWYYYDGGVTSAKDNNIFNTYENEEHEIVPIDPRVASLGGQYAYAFGQKDNAVSVQEFGAYAQNVGALLVMVTNPENKPEYTPEVINSYVTENNLQNEYNTIMYILSHNTNGQPTAPGQGQTILEQLMIKDSSGTLAAQYIMYANSAHINTRYDDGGEIIDYDLLLEVVYQFPDGVYNLPMKILIGSGMTDELENGAKAWSDAQLEMPNLEG